MARKLNYKLIAGLYNAGYSQGDIAYIFQSVSGHISKVLKAEGVQIRPRGVKVKPPTYAKFPASWKTALGDDETRKRAHEVSEAHKQKEKGKQKQAATKKVETVKAAAKVAEPKKEDTKTKVVSEKKTAPKKKVADLTNEDVKRMSIQLLEDWVKNTPLKGVRFTQKNSLSGEYGAVSSSVTVEAGYRETKDVFLWITERNVGDYHDISCIDRDNDEFPMEVQAMDAIYDAYSVIDSTYCKNLDKVEKYGEKRAKDLMKKYPKLDVRYSVDGTKDRLYASVSVSVKK